MKTKLLAGMILVALVLCVPAAWAQQKDPRVNPPVEPLSPLPANESSSRTTPAEVVPAETAPAASAQSQRPLTSAEPWALGLRAGGRSFVFPSLRFFQGADTSPRVQSGRNDGVEATTVFSGRLTVQRIWANQEFSFDYSGGGQFYSRSSDLNASFHQGGLTYRVNLRKWSLLFADQGGYSTEAGGGYGSFGGSLPIGSGPIAGNLNQFLLPEQSILTSRTPRVSNTVLGEAHYSAGRRSTLTFSGAYGILRYLDVGFLDGSTATFSAGYNYAVTGKDTVALSYSANLLRFSDLDQRVNSHYVHVSYGRRITGSLAWQVAAGPLINSFENGMNGSDTGISWSLQTSLLYRYAQGGVHLQYQRGVTGGSGVLVGAVTNDVGVGLSRQLSRLWRGSVDFRYAHNDRLKQVVSSGGGFNTWQMGMSLHRPVGRYTRLYLRYGMQRQTSTVPGLGAGLRHTFGIGFDFRFRPIDIE